MLAIAIWFLIKQVDRSGGGRATTAPNRENPFQVERPEVPSENVNKSKMKGK